MAGGRTYAYLAETGDASILTEPVPFNNVEGSEVPLLEHLRRSVNFTITHKGPHGLPPIGRADWNDCLNLNCFSDTPGESFQTVENNDTGVAESVFIGGIFCHNNPWISIANALAGNDDEAFAVYQRNCPAYVEDKSDVRKVEPYVYCQMVAGPEAATPGEGKNSWLTGTAAWTFVDVSQYLLGVRPTLDGLAIEPHLPERFTELVVTRVFRGTTYRIRMTRTGERTVSVDGKQLNGNVVPAQDEDGTVEVEITF